MVCLSISFPETVALLCILNKSSGVARNQPPSFWANSFWFTESFNRDFFQTQHLSVIQMNH
uniref:Uncharacterized protein n=1 Tax=Brassica oleracea TaxID=3712 RepID=A0A3P6GGM1_BRAOL|nr:unnamed protein product [Brassica oleracea]